eukprot:2974046-Amphidinium_carterae.2
MIGAAKQRVDAISVSCTQLGCYRKGVCTEAHADADCCSPWMDMLHVLSVAGRGVPPCGQFDSVSSGVR